MEVLDSVTGLFEEVGRQLSFYLRIIGDIFTLQVIRRRYLGIVFSLMSDIAIGAGALIVGGGMIFVIFSMSFFTGTEVGLQGSRGCRRSAPRASPGSSAPSPTPGRSPR